MPEFSLNVLRSWKPETLIAAAVELGEKTTGLEGINNEIADMNNREGAQSEGTAAEARYEYLKATTSFIDDKAQLMREEKQIWEEAGNDLAAKHNRLFTAVQAALQAGFVVNSKGGVEGDYPRQSQELFDKHAEAIGRAKHELEQADELHSQKIREISGRIKEGTGNTPHETKDWLTFGGSPKDEPLDPKKVPSAPKEPVIHDNDPSWPNGKQVHLGLNLPPYEPGTLDNTDTRTVYTTGEQKIREMIAQDQAKGLSAEQVAKNAFERRNALRTWCRQLMADQAVATGLNQTDPNLTWEQLMQKQAAKGNTGEAAYNAIIESSTRSRPSVNQRTGVDPENPGPLPPVRSAPQPAPPPEPRPAEPPSAGRMRPEPEGGGGGRMRPQIQGEIVPPGSVAGQYGEQRRGE